MKTFTELTEELKLPVHKLVKIRDQKLIEGEDWMKKDGKCVFSEAGVEKVKLAIEIPLAVPKRIKVKVLTRAPNPHWVYAKKDNDYRKIIVAVRPSWCDRLVGKFINVDVIEDANGGITYRHEALGK